jgi:S1-C subfamily serine protease
LTVAACSSPLATSEPAPTGVDAPATTTTPIATTGPNLVKVATVPTAESIPPEDLGGFTVDPTSSAPPPPAPLSPAQAQLPNIADTVERVRPAVVSIVAETVFQDVFGDQHRQFSSASGVIFDPQGLILTTNHVVEGATRVTVTSDDGSQVDAEILGADPWSDLAVLKIPGNSHPSIPLKADVPLRVGDWVIAIGNALALPGGPTVTVGVVSALGRSLDFSPEITLYDLIQTDTVINPGNSGGPLLNVQGDLVGISTAVQRFSSGGAPVEGIGFAIDMGTAFSVTEQLISLGHVRWPWMGAYLVDLDPEGAARAGLPVKEGVVVRGLFKGGPAEQSGLKLGDIILSMKGHKVDSLRELTRLLRQEFEAGHVVEVELIRDGSNKKIFLFLAERPN